MRRFFLCTVLAGLFFPLASASAATSLPGGLKGKTAAEVLAQSKAAALSQTSGLIKVMASSKGVHVKEVIRCNGDNVQMTIKTNGGTGSGETRFVDGHMYVKGNSLWMSRMFQQVVKGAQSKYVNKWIDAPITGKLVTVADSVRLSGGIGQIFPAAKLSMGSLHTFHGVKTVALRGTQGSMGITTYISLTAPYLPVGAVLVTKSGSQIYHMTMLASRWGDNLTVTAPTGAVPSSQAGF